MIKEIEAKTQTKKNFENAKSMELLNFSLDSKTSNMSSFEGYDTVDNRKSYINLKNTTVDRAEFNSILKNLCSISQFNVDIFTGPEQHRNARKSFTIAFKTDDERENTEEDTAGYVDFQQETFKYKFMSHALSDYILSYDIFYNEATATDKKNSKDQFIFYPKDSEIFNIAVIFAN